MVHKLIILAITLCGGISLYLQADTCTYLPNQISVSQSVEVTDSGQAAVQQCGLDALNNFSLCALGTESMTATTLKDLSTSIKVLTGKPTDPDFSSLTDSDTVNAFYNMSLNQISSLENQAIEAMRTIPNTVQPSSTTCQAKGTVPLKINPALQNELAASQQKIHDQMVAQFNKAVTEISVLQSGNPYLFG